MRIEKNFRRSCRETGSGSDVPGERRENPMKYMLLMNFPYGKWSTDSIFTWPEEDAKAHIACLRRLNEELSANGEYVTAQGLAGPGEGESGPARPDRAPPVGGG